MKISIITVCFNSQQTIARTLQSIDVQDYFNYEHIIIDGASYDSTLDIIDQYKNPRRKVYSKKDNGIYDAMNIGLNVASGDIVCFLNADDFYAYNGVLSTVVNKFSDLNLDALFGDVVYFAKGDPAKIVRRYSSAQFHPKMLSKGIIPAPPTFFLKYKIYRKYGFFNTDYKIAGDFEFIARAFKDNTINYFYLKKVITKMQVGGVSNSGFVNTIILNKEILRACRENNISTNYIKLLSRYPRKFLEYFLF